LYFSEQREKSRGTEGHQVGTVQYGVWVQPVLQRGNQQQYFDFRILLWNVFSVAEGLPVRRGRAADQEPQGSVSKETILK